MHRDAGAQCRLAAISRRQRAPAAHGVIKLHGPAVLAGNAPFACLAGAAGTTAQLSRDAGRYLCNYVYWRALEQVHGTRPLVQFVHNPLVGTKPRRRRSKRPPTLAQLLKPAEALLIALIAASRR